MELIEFGQRLPRPVLIARKGERRIAVRGSRGGARYGFRVVFPAAGRWRLTLLDGKRRFVFPAVSVGTGDVPLDYVAFPQGSMAERQGRAVFTTSRPSRWAAAATARSAGDRLAGGALHRRRLPVVGPPGGRSRTGRGGNRHRARPRIAACEY